MIYPYKCDCGNYEEFVDSMDNSSKNRVCSVCGDNMYRVYDVKIGNKEYAKPLHSDSLGMNPNQVAEHRRLFPDVPVDSDARPVFTNVKQHDRYLSKTGFYKHPQKIKLKGKRVNS